MRPKRTFLEGILKNYCPYVVQSDMNNVLPIAQSNWTTLNFWPVFGHFPDEMSKLFCTYPDEMAFSFYGQNFIKIVHWKE